MPYSTHRRRRVLITLPDLALGGGQRIVLNYLAHRNRDEFDVQILTLYPEPDEMADEFSAAEVPVLCLNHQPGRRLNGIRRLASLLRAEAIDLVHPHGPADRKLAVPAALVARTPVLCHLHSEWNHRGVQLPADPTPVDRWKGRLNGRLRDLAEDQVVKEYLADSQPVADVFGRYVRQPVHAMAQSMPFEAMAAAAAAHDDQAWRADLGLGCGPVAINVSRMAEGKGQDRLIRALAVVRESVPDAQLVLVGDGELRPAFEQLTRQLGLEGCVHFTGTRRDIPRLLVGADVFAFGSVTESFGLVVAEAMAARLPVVAFRLPSLDDFSVDGVTGAYPAQADDAGFARALAEVLGAPATARRMGHAGFSLVSERFPAWATADSFEAAYRRVLGVPAVPPTRRPGAPEGSTSPAQPDLASKG